MVLTGISHQNSSKKSIKIFWNVNSVSINEKSTLGVIEISLLLELLVYFNKDKQQKNTNDFQDYK